MEQQSRVVLYADDATLISNEGVAAGNGSLDMAKNWFQANKLKLNESKTQHILFSLDKFAEKSEPVKLLGIVLDTSLTWSSQIDRLCSKISSQIFVLRQLRKNISDNNVMKVAYCALIHSHLSYGISLWGNSSRLHKVFSLQKAAIRIVDGSAYRAHCIEIFKKYKILCLPCQYIFDQLLRIHRDLNSISSHSDLHGYSTRNANDLVNIFSRLSTAKRNRLDFNLFNKLDKLYPEEKIKEMSDAKFSKFVRIYLIEHCFYSIDEYMSYSFESALYLNT